MITIGIDCEPIEKKEWGIGRITTRLLENIANRPELKDEFKFVLFFKSADIPNLPFLDNPLFTKKVIKLPGQWFSSFTLYYYIMLPIYLWLKRVDVMFFPNYMLSPLFSGTSIVHMTNDLYYEMQSPSQKIQHKIAYRFFGKWAARHATKLLTWSEAAKKEISQLFKVGEDRIAVSHLGIDFKETASDLEARNAQYICYLGQAFPRRHVKETLQAFEKIAPEFPDLEFVMVGKDNYRPPILDKLIFDINHRLGRNAIEHHHFIERDETILNIYANAQLVVYVSDHEAFGLPPLEALRHGSVPVVADNDLSHELYGDNAFFVPTMHDVDALADTLREGLTNKAKRDKIKQNGPKITEQYTWQNYTDNFLQLCKDLAQ